MGSPDCHPLVQAPKDVHRNRVGLTMFFFFIFILKLVKLYNEEHCYYYCMTDVSNN